MTRSHVVDDQPVSAMSGCGTAFDDVVVVLRVAEATARPVTWEELLAHLTRRNATPEQIEASRGAHLYFSGNLRMVAANDALPIQQVASRAVGIIGPERTAIEAWLENMSRSAEEASDSSSTPPQKREYICGKMVWCEALGRLKSEYHRAEELRMAEILKSLPGWQCAGRRRFPFYGQQRAFYRVAP